LVWRLPIDTFEFAGASGATGAGVGSVAVMTGTRDGVAAAETGPRVGEVLGTTVTGVGLLPEATASTLLLFEVPEKFSIMEKKIILPNYLGAAQWKITQ
jgi:hypothetical protein